MSRVRGWCPSAHRPMASGDGLLVRIRPPMARVTSEQGVALAELSAQYGNGLIDLTSRANLQFRGVDAEDYPALLSALIDLRVVAPEPHLELPLTVTPFPDPDGLTERLLGALQACAADIPALPGKIGIVIDTGAARWLRDVSGDFRFERGDGGLILRADGASVGWPVRPEDAADALIEMARWFTATGGPEHRRMRHHLTAVALPAKWERVAPVAASDATLVPNLRTGQLGVPFGQLTAEGLRDLCSLSEVCQVVFTPWRLLRITDMSGDPTDMSDAACAGRLPTGLLTDMSEPITQIVACPGAPHCAQASVDTRELGEELARFLPGPVHISGCGKGCARQAPASTTIVGRDGQFDLVQNGTPADAPRLSGLSKADLLAHFAGAAKATPANGKKKARTP